MVICNIMGSFNQCCEIAAISSTRYCLMVLLWLTFKKILSHHIDLFQGRIKPVRLGGGRFQKHLVVKSHYEFIAVREMNYTSQHCCDKTRGDKMVLYRECCFL